MSLGHPAPYNAMSEIEKRQHEIEALIPSYSQKGDTELRAIMATWVNQPWKADFQAAERVLELRRTEADERRHNETREIAQKAIKLSVENNVLTHKSNLLALCAIAIAVIALIIAVVEFVRK